MPQLVENRGALEVRDGTVESPLRRMRAADPGQAEDLVTKGYADAHYIGGGGLVPQTDNFNVSIPGTTEFTLTHTPFDSAAVIMTVNGIVQTIGLNFSCVGTLVTWLDVNYHFSTDDHVSFAYQRAA